MSSTFHLFGPSKSHCQGRMVSQVQSAAACTSCSPASGGTTCLGLRGNANEANEHMSKSSPCAAVTSTRARFLRPCFWHFWRVSSTTTKSDEDDSLRSVWRRRHNDVLYDIERKQKMKEFLTVWRMGCLCELNQWLWRWIEGKGGGKRRGGKHRGKS